MNYYYIFKIDIDKLITLHNISEMAISKSNSNCQKNTYVHGKYNVFIIYIIYIYIFIIYIYL